MAEKISCTRTTDEKISCRVSHEKEIRETNGKLVLPNLSSTQKNNGPCLMYCAVATATKTALKWLRGGYYNEGRWQSGNIFIFSQQCV